MIVWTDRAILLPDMLRTVAGKILSTIYEFRINARDYYYFHSPTVRHSERVTPCGFRMVSGNSLSIGLSADFVNVMKSVVVATPIPHFVLSDP